jgi:hypothetical protein
MPSRLLGSETNVFFWGEDISPNTNPQPGGSVCLSLTGTLLKICPGWVALPATMLPPAERVTLLVQIVQIVPIITIISASRFGNFVAYNLRIRGRVSPQCASGCLEVRANILPLLVFEPRILQSVA